VRHSFAARKWTTAPPIPARIRATWTPSGRCGICSISRRRAAAASTLSCNTWMTRQDNANPFPVGYLFLGTWRDLSITDRPAFLPITPRF
jgi:hypothetical protein